jgi:SAM-dependent methyltransferase
MRDATQRFSDRVANYVKYRPHYPAAMAGVLAERIGLLPSWRVADIGSGTGISCEPFLEFGCTLVAVEPNREMREAAEAWLGHNPSFHSLDGRAEATGLDPDSVDLVVVGQAFHWFDRTATRLEAFRILRDPKRALLMWNDWHAGGAPFLRDYDALLRARMPERSVSDHRNLGASDFDAFFGPGRWERVELPNKQLLDFEGLKGRLLSASYAPKEGACNYEETMADLAAMFERHAEGGVVEFVYTTLLYFGEMG